MIKWPRAVEATDPDPDGTLTHGLATAPTAMTIDPASGLIAWLPTATDIGKPALGVTVTDQEGLADTQAFTLQVRNVNDPPSAVDLTVSTDEDTPVSVVLAGADIDGDALTFSIITPPTGGTLSGTPPDLTYTPNPDFYGSDGFSYGVSDGALGSGNATVGLSIAAVTGIGGIFSAALSVGSRPPGVTWHPARWSPDFPPRPTRGGATVRPAPTV